jgi:hypothetical protein
VRNSWGAAAHDGGFFKLPTSAWNGSAWTLGIESGCGWATVKGWELASDLGFSADGTKPDESE